MPVSTGLASSSSGSYHSSVTGEPKPKRCKHCDDAVHSPSSTSSSGSSGSGGGYWRIPLDQDLLTTIAAIYPDWFKATTPAPSTTEPNNNVVTTSSPSPKPDSPPVMSNNNNLTTNFNDHNICQTTIPNGVVVLATTTNGVTPILATTAATGSSPRSPQSPPKAVVDTSPLQNAMDKNKESLKVKLMLRRPINQLVAQGIMPPLKTPPAFHEQRRQLERAKTGDLLKAKIQQRPARIELERLHILECSSAPIDPSLAERQRMLKKARLADQLNDQLSHRPGPLELIQKNILHTEEPIEEAVKTGKIEFSATCEGLSKPQHPTTYTTTEDDSQSSESDVIEHAAKNAGIVVTFADLCQSVTAGLPPPQASPAPGKSRKKSKMKSQPKARTIKFHEYKGPPNAQKNLLNGNNAGKTSYQILLEQQQLFLQWQLEWQHKYPQIILPATQKIESPVGSPTSSVTSSVDSKTRLEDMKVSDLKMELKRRNLPVSGSKPQLIERLKPFTEPVTHSGHIIMDTPRPSDESVADTDDKSSVASPVSSDPDLTSPVTNDDIVREQQRKIEELQRELTRSQLQLQQVRSGVGQKIALQQHVQARQALRQQQQQVVAAFQKNVNGLLLNGLVLNQLIVPTIITPQQQQQQQQPQPPPQQQQPTPQQQQPPPQQHVSQPQPVIPDPPPLPPTPPRPTTPEPIKSQIVDDVLEILIKNGELPPSAANAPITPVDEDHMQIEPVSAAISEQMNQELSEAITKQRELDFPNDLKDLALELETLGDFSMELDEPPIKVETMEMDESDWLDSLMSSHGEESNHLEDSSVHEQELESVNSYDPLLVGNSFHDFELFGLEEFRNQNLDLSSSGMNVPITWDKLDFAA